MLAHLLKAAVRSLAVTAVLGGILIYATGGPDSSTVRGMAGIIAICFLMFWMTFFFMFGPSLPKHDGAREDDHHENASHLSFRTRRRDGEDHESDMNESGTGSD